MARESPSGPADSEKKQNNCDQHAGHAVYPLEKGSLFTRFLTSTPILIMKFKYIALFVAFTGVAIAGPDRPGFTTPPSWIDLDNNGEIDEAERAAFIQARKDAAKGLADRADANGNGEVDEEERQNMIAAMHANVEAKRCELFEAIAGEDLLMDLDEFSSTHPVNKLPEFVVTRLFALLDVGDGDGGDPDGLVSKDEFLLTLNAPDDGEPETPDGP
jgi:hypothetical protein